MKRRNGFTIAGAVLAIILMAAFGIFSAYGQEGEGQAPPPPADEQPADKPSEAPPSDEQPPVDQPPADGEQDGDDSGNGAGGEAEGEKSDEPTEGAGTDEPNGEQSSPGGSTPPVGGPTSPATEPSPSGQSSLDELFRKLDDLRVAVADRIGRYPVPPSADDLQRARDAVAEAERLLQEDDAPTSTTPVGLIVQQKTAELRRLTEELKTLRARYSSEGGNK